MDQLVAFELRSGRFTREKPATMWIQFDTNGTQREIIQMVRARYPMPSATNHRVTLESEHHLYDFWFDSSEASDAFWNRIQGAIKDQTTYLDLTICTPTWVCNGAAGHLYNVHVGDGIVDVRVANVVEVKNEELGGTLEVALGGR